MSPGGLRQTRKGESEELPRFLVFRGFHRLDRVSRVESGQGDPTDR